MIDPTTRMTLERSAALALDGIPRAYPSKIAHLLHGPDDARAPRELTPVFYGCFDWHSAVHAHWLLVRVARTLPGSPVAGAARARLHASFTRAGIAGEVAYLDAPGRAGFERPYGLAWMLQLVAELREWSDPDARAWATLLAPLEDRAADRLLAWLPLLSHPVRSGGHDQTAFAIALALDWARTCTRTDAVRLLESRVLDFHGTDAGWRFAFEPSGQDFLSPGLATADLVRRVLDRTEFAAWLDRFAPELREQDGCAALRPEHPSDPTDGRLVHLDGLNLSRAWMLEGIGAALPPDDTRRVALDRAAAAHRAAGLAALERDDYAGTHWLGTFATYLVTGRNARSAE